MRVRTQQLEEKRRFLEYQTNLVLQLLARRDKLKEEKRQWYNTRISEQEEKVCGGRCLSSVKIVGISILVPALEDLFDRLVLGLRSLEAQDVGAVEWDSIEPWFGSEDTVIVDKDEAMPFMSVGD